MSVEQLNLIKLSPKYPYYAKQETSFGWQDSCNTLITSQCLS